jgi:hypothetical protein
MMDFDRSEHVSWIIALDAAGETREKNDDERNEGAAHSISACDPVVLPLRNGKAGGDGDDGCVGAFTAQRKLAVAANKEVDL